MKAIKILVPVNLTSGDTQGANSIVVIYSATEQVSNNNGTTMPYVIVTNLYKSENAYANGKRPIQGIADFNPVFEVDVPLLSYTDVKLEKQLIDAVKNELIAIYGAANISEINL